MFACRNIATKAIACIKLEAVDAEKPQLALECCMYAHLTPAKSYILRLLGHGTSGDYRFLVMDLGGCDLSKLAPSCSLRIKLKIFYNLICALEQFSIAGVVHRDVKPKNILLKNSTSSGQFGVPKRLDKPDVVLIDFGFSKRFRINGIHHKNRHKELSVGTGTYSSPYSQMFTEASRRDDMYSLCYTMCTVFGKELPWQAAARTQDSRTSFDSKSCDTTSSGSSASGASSAFSKSSGSYESSCGFGGSRESRLYDSASCEGTPSHDRSRKSTSSYSRSSNSQSTTATMAHSTSISRTSCNSDNRKRNRELRLKRMCTAEDVCSGCPRSLCIVYQRVMLLGFAEVPPYGWFKDIVAQDLKGLPTR